MQNLQEGFYARSKFLSRCPQGITNKIIFLYCSFAYGRICVRASKTCIALWKCKLRLVQVQRSNACTPVEMTKFETNFLKCSTSTIPLRNRVFNCNLIKSSSSIILQNCGYAIAMPIAAQLLDHRATFRLNRARSAGAAQSFQTFCGAMHCTSRTLRHETGCGPMFAAATL